VFAEDHRAEHQLGRAQRAAWGFVCCLRGPGSGRTRDSGAKILLHHGGSRGGGEEGAPRSQRGTKWVGWLLPGACGLPMRRRRSKRSGRSLRPPARPSDLRGFPLQHHIGPAPGLRVPAHRNPTSFRLKGQTGDRVAQRLLLMRRGWETLDRGAGQRNPGHARHSRSVARHSLSLATSRADLAASATLNL
jgi:hypothetical protein